MHEEIYVIREAGAAGEERNRIGKGWKGIKRADVAVKGKGWNLNRYAHCF